MLAIESEAESNSGLRSDEPAEGMAKRSAGTGPTVQAASANTRATPLAKNVPTPMEVQGEEEVETEVAMEISTPTLEELASAVPSSATPATITIYSTIVSSPTPTPIPIYSKVLSVHQVPPSPTPISNNHKLHCNLF